MFKVTKKKKNRKISSLGGKNSHANEKIQKQLLGGVL